MAPTYHALAPRNPKSKTGRVWGLAEEITRMKRRRATRGEVIDAYVAEGGNPDTASTQYWHWKKTFEDEHEERSETDPAIQATPKSVAAARLVIGADGRVVIPAEMRNAMQIGSDGKITARVVDGEFRVIAPAVAIRRARDLVRATIPAGASLADELIAERRAEAHLEDAE